MESALFFTAIISAIILAAYNVYQATLLSTTPAWLLTVVLNQRHTSVLSVTLASHFKGLLASKKKTQTVRHSVQLTFALAAKTVFNLLDKLASEIS